ncbi:MAG: NlpC/P60 family protein [Ruminococcaceae bacterium]|nr:NlpC/P60 family protein [Oscillospiraceae bacterium]
MKLTHRIASLVLAIFIIIGVTAPVANASARQLKTGIAFVNASSLRLRSSASTSSKTLDYAYRNEVVVVLGKTGSWYKVNYNLQNGYMHESYLRYTTREDGELGYGALNGNKVKIRSGPSTGHSILTTASIGDKVYIIGINNQWFKVIFGNHIGYIRSDYVDLTEIPYENNDSSKSPLFFRGGKSTGLKPSPEALRGESTGSLASSIIATAKQYIGVPYLWGGTTPKGFDCSGYVQYVFNKHGISLPRVSKDQYKVGTAVSKSNLIPGDLVFFNTSGSGVSHLGIYLGSGQFIHASTSKGVVITNLNNSYWTERCVGARRVI